MKNELIIKVLAWLGWIGAVVSIVSNAIREFPPIPVDKKQNEVIENDTE